MKSQSLSRYTLLPSPRTLSTSFNGKGFIEGGVESFKVNMHGDLGKNSRKVMFKNFESFW